MYDAEIVEKGSKIASRRQRGLPSDVDTIATVSDGHILSDAEVGEQPEILDQEANLAPLGRQSRDIAAAD